MKAFKRSSDENDPIIALLIDIDPVKEGTIARNTTVNDGCAVMSPVRDAVANVAVESVIEGDGMNPFSEIVDVMVPLS